MSAPQGCTDDTAVVEFFKEALKQRIGADRFRMWFTRGVSFTLDAGDLEEGGVGRQVVVAVHGQFALDRMRQHFMRELRGAAAQVDAGLVDVRITLMPHASDAAIASPAPPKRGVSVARASAIAEEPAAAATASLPSTPRKLSSVHSTAKTNGGQRASFGNAKAQKASSAKACPAKPQSPARDAERSTGRERIGDTRREADAREGGVEPAVVARPAMTFETFIPGEANELALTAAKMCCQDPAMAAPLLLVGNSGVGKTHLMTAIADRFRRGRRMRRVIQLSAEQFTNDFIKSVSSSGLPAFRRRYRDVDALLIDDVQFLAAKKATLREMLYTIDTLAAAGRPLVFTADRSPAEISGLTKELAGRMSAGLVCPLRPLDSTTRETLLRRLIEQRCLLPWPEEVIVEINGIVSGDGRMLSGIVNLVGTLQRMHRRMPTMDEIRQYGGEMLRSQAPVVTLAAIERAVCEAFELEDRALRAAVQTRSITEPRMLAMYLSRQLTSSAFSEIARHYGGRSHTTAIAANRKVETWLNSGHAIGRGRQSMSARQALERIESILRAG